jgi:nucleotide-binding universal stress UspA family protein
MSLIITATDFSDVATHAAHYACLLAQTSNAPVVVMHTFILPVAFNDVPMPVIPIDEARQTAEDSINSFVRELQQAYPGLSITGKVSYGDITDSLQEYAEETHPALVVIGNSNEEGMSFWWGSNMLSALKNLPCPVVAVPLTSTYSGVKNICFACDYKDISERIPADQLIEMVKSTGAQLHILNVSHDNKNFAVETPLESSILHELLGSASPIYHYADNEDVDTGIQNFIEGNNMDWLVVMPHKHSFLAGLFHKSHTSSMARMSHVPLVAIHEKA